MRGPFELDLRCVMEKSKQQQKNTTNQRKKILDSGNSNKQRDQKNIHLTLNNY
jgi:hypothetical protein